MKHMVRWCRSPRWQRRSAFRRQRSRRPIPRRRQPPRSSRPGPSRRNPATVTRRDMSRRTWPTASPTCRASGRTPPTRRMTRPAKFKSLIMTRRREQGGAGRQPGQHPPEDRRQPEGVRRPAQRQGPRLRPRLQRVLDRSRARPTPTSRATWRTSWIVDPANGQMPFSEDGTQAGWPRSASRAARATTIRKSAALGERCIVGFGGTGGPPMINVLYNNNYQIVAVARRRGDRRRDGSTTRASSAEAPSTSPPSDQPYLGDCDRLVGGRHAGGRDDQPEPERRQPGPAHALAARSSSASRAMTTTRSSTNSR